MLKVGCACNGIGIQVQNRGCVKVIGMSNIALAKRDVQSAGMRKLSNIQFYLSW